MLDDASIQLSCPGCTQQMIKTFGWITSHKELVCSGCGESITLQTDKLTRGLKEAARAASPAS